MAILRKGQPGENGMELEINNGDLKVLREIYEKWGFKDEESVLRFALAVLSKSTKQVLYYEDEQGQKVGIQPSDAIKKQPIESASGT